ncbi:MAG: phosphoribosylformylglycinamidine synthase subunit PurQ [SAR202 cluster bacterium]|nr:phosphoribosylformylglycinamidine synthase subunit PurQ [SAR202 cluster bacterium]
MLFGIIVFPGTWSDTDCFYAIQDVLGFRAEYVWHEETDLSRFDCLILPGGFSYGDYLRTGSIAKLSPIIASLDSFINSGKLVIGICNGFQILCECGFLPGVLLKNDCLEYRCVPTNLKVASNDHAFSNLCNIDEILDIPISHGEGNYYADQETISNLEANNQIAFRYSSPDGDTSAEYNPNGSINNIAGILNASKNVLGMMPHPERCCESILGSEDGAMIFKSISEWINKNI